MIVWVPVAVAFAASVVSVVFAARADRALRRADRDFHEAVQAAARRLAEQRRSL